MSPQSESRPVYSFSKTYPLLNKQKNVIATLYIQGEVTLPCHSSSPASIYSQNTILIPYAPSIQYSLTQDNVQLNKCFQIKSPFSATVNGNDNEGRIYSILIQGFADGTRIIKVIQILDVLNIITGAFGNTMPVVSYLQWSNGIFLPKTSPSYIALNEFTSVPRTVDEYIQRINIINTPNADVIYSPMVVDLTLVSEGGYGALQLPVFNATSTNFWVCQFVDIFGRIFHNVTSGTVNASGLYNLIPPFKTKSTYATDIHCPSWIIYVLFRVQVDLTNE